MPHQSATGLQSATSSAPLPRHHAPDTSPLRSLLSVEELKAEYDIDPKVIGRGAHGVVLKAVHRKTKIACAIKTRCKAGAPPHQLLYNRNEGEILTRHLHHENIVEAREYFETSDTHLVMELAEHGDLLELVNRRIGVTELEASLISMQLMDSLQYAHDLGFVHGDFKLENILITRASPQQALRFGVEQRFLLCDWGFAHAHTHGEVSERKFGSLRYQSPEIFTACDCSPRVDIWALGVVMYGMVCATLPFEGRNAAEIVDKIKRCAYTFPQRVSAEFRAVISSILQLDAAARPTLAQLREHPWFNAAKDYRRRLAEQAKPRVVPPSPATPKNKSRSSSSSPSTKASVSVPVGKASHTGSLPQIAPSPRSSPPATPPGRASASNSPPDFSTLSVKTQLEPPSPALATSLPMATPTLSAYPSKQTAQQPQTPGCWYLGDDTA